MAIAMFFFGLAPRATPEVSKVDPVAPIPRSRFHSFCFHFSFLYWSIYCIPTLLAYCLPVVGPILVTDIESVNAKVIEWTAKNLFRIDRELVPPNGSGDTTYNYISILIGFTVSFTLAILWTIFESRTYRFAWRNDLLQMCLRYALAFTMMHYGLAKLSLEFGQFPPPQPGQLDKTWGDSSPMNVLWTFMGYSRAYTFFLGNRRACIGSFATLATHDITRSTRRHRYHVQRRDAQFFLRCPSEDHVIALAGHSLLDRASRCESTVEFASLQSSDIRCRFGWTLDEPICLVDQSRLEDLDPVGVLRMACRHTMHCIDRRSATF